MRSSFVTHQALDLPGMLSALGRKVRHQCRHVSQACLHQKGTKGAFSGGNCSQTIQLLCVLQGCVSAVQKEH